MSYPSIRASLSISSLWWKKIMPTQIASYIIQPTISKKPTVTIPDHYMSGSVQFLSMTTRSRIVETSLWQHPKLAIEHNLKKIIR
jgi:hypothetical protein